MKRYVFVLLAIIILLFSIMRESKVSRAAIIKNLSSTRIIDYTVAVIYSDPLTIEDIILSAKAKRYASDGEYYDVVMYVRHWSDLNSTWKSEIKQHLRALQKQCNLIGIDENTDTLPNLPE